MPLSRIDDEDWALSSRRRWVAAALGAIVLPLRAQTSGYPRGPVKIIVPFPPGGPTDTIARLLSQQLQDAWGHPVLIEYKPGGGTVIGVDAVAKAPADGHVFGMVNSSFAVNPALRAQMPYRTPQDLAPITQIANLQLAWVARPDAPFNTLAELIAYAKKHPGQLVYGTPGAGSTTHLSMELLKHETGIDILHSPFKGSAPAHTELLGGRIDLVADPFLSIIPFVKAGRMKMIATLGPRKVRGYDFPIAADTLPNFIVNAMLGLVAPARTPKAVVHKIQGDIARILQAPQTMQQVEELGMEVVASTPEAYERFIAAEMLHWGRVVKEAHIQPE
jgi:tripartite-type tricarboxylate transporter receptor subunit TctC